MGIDEPPFVAHSDTSRAAAESMKKVAPSYEAQVLDFIRRRGSYGATADECLEALGLTHQNGSARVSTLARKGAIIRTDKGRLTRSGRMARVYVAKGVYWGPPEHHQV